MTIFQGDVPFGPNHTFRFGTLALAHFQKGAGKTLSAISEMLSPAENGEGQSEINFDHLLVLIQAGLLHHHDEISRRDVADLIDKMGIAGISAALSSAFNEALPSGGGNAPGKAQSQAKKKRPT